MAGDKFPEVTAKTLDGQEVTLGKPANGADWQLVVVYRGRHCPLCTKYLNNLEGFKQRLLDNRVDLIAVSGDSKEQLENHLEKLNVSFPLYYGLTIDQMQMEKLGVYISIPRSEKETDHNFPEPGLFVVNEDGNLHVVDISNNPFVRPELEALVSGLDWIRNPDNNYPIRGTYK
jgi:peroxiredoxin